MLEITPNGIPSTMPSTVPPRALGLRRKTELLGLNISEQNFLIRSNRLLPPNKQNFMDKGFWIRSIQTLAICPFSISWGRIQMLDVCWYDRPDTGERRLEMANWTWSPHEGQRSLRWEKDTEESPLYSQEWRRDNQRERSPWGVWLWIVCCLRISN